MTTTTAPKTALAGSAETAVEWLDRQSRDNPGSPALLIGTEVVSYGQLATRVSRIAAALASDHPPGSLVFAPMRRVDLALLLPAAAWSGLILAPMLQDSTDEEVRRLSSSWGAGRVLRGLPQPTTTGAIRPADPLRPSLVIPSSGSSGHPKGALLSQSNLAAAVAGSKTRLGLENEDCWLCCLPLHHIGGLSILLRCLEAGAPVMLHPGFDPARVMAALQQGRVTHVSLVPSMLAQLVALQTRPHPSLRVALIGGAALSQPLLEQALALGWPLCLSYGLTEAASQVATECRATDLTAGRCGLPLPHLQLEILDNRGAATEGAGRIALRGPSVMLGYANPEGQLGVGLQDGRFISSDIGRLDRQGRLELIGRADLAITSGGNTVQPEQIEAELRRHPGITDAAVVGTPDPVWGERIVAFITGTADPQQVQQWCMLEIPSERRPRRVIHLQQLPLLDSGKLDRPRLRQLAQT